MTLGDYVINSAVEPLPAYTFGVRKISVHPFFKFTPQADRFDVAVLRLDRPVQYMPHIAPICLPDKGEDFLGHYGWAAGWGALQAGKCRAVARIPPSPDRGKPPSIVSRLPMEKRRRLAHLFLVVVQYSSVFDRTKRHEEMKTRSA